jgi:speckle-type POZ protein
VICSRSEYFRALCLGGLRESRQNQIRIRDTPSLAFKTVLEFLYTKEFDEEQLGESIVEVLITANKFGCDKLKEQLELVIATNLTVENVSSLFVVADQHYASELKQHCYTFILQNYNEVIKTNEYQIISGAVEKLLEEMKKSTQQQPQQ